jgi:hypothetical protein
MTINESKNLMKAKIGSDNDRNAYWPNHDNKNSIISLKNRKNIDRTEALSNKVSFSKINQFAMPVLVQLIRELLPNGKRVGNEWVAINPNRRDTKMGSFKINLLSGKWSDFAIEARGGDIISLYAYVNNISQTKAAKMLAVNLGAHHE